MTEINEPTPENRIVEEPMTPAEIVGWAEFACWTMVALAPFLYWVNGPAVSTDQFVVRTALVTLAIVGAVTIRLTKWIRVIAKRSKERKLREGQDA